MLHLILPLLTAAVLSASVPAPFVSVLREIHLSGEPVRPGDPEFGTPAYIAEYCEIWREMARAAMTGRQDDVPATVLLRALEQSGAPPDMLAEAQAMILDAYTEPVWRFPEIRQQAISDFADKHQARCIRSFF